MNIPAKYNREIEGRAVILVHEYFDQMLIEHNVNEMDVHL